MIHRYLIRVLDVTPGRRERVLAGADFTLEQARGMGFALDKVAGAVGQSMKELTPSAPLTEIKVQLMLEARN